MGATTIRVRGAIERIVHHYFFPPGSTMVRFPTLRFSKRHPENRRVLVEVLLAEKRLGRLHQWYMDPRDCKPPTARTPEPIPELRRVL